MESKKQAIFRAVLTLLQDRSPSEITVSEIAKNAGIGKGTVYEYFTSKEELIVFTVREAIEIHLKNLQSVNLSGAFEQICRRVFLCFQQDFSSCRLLFGLFFPENGPSCFSVICLERLGPELRQMQRRFTVFLRRLETIGVQQGIIPGGCSSMDLLFAFYSVAGMLGHLTLMGKKRPGPGSLSFCYRKFIQLLCP